MWSLAYIAASIAHSLSRMRNLLLGQIDRFGIFLCVIVVAIASALLGVFSPRLSLLLAIALPVAAMVLEGLASLSSRPQDFRPFSFHVPSDREVIDAMKLFGVALSPILGLLLASAVDGKFRCADQ